MQLDQYLQEIKDCPDTIVQVHKGYGKNREMHSLTARLGLYDGYLMFLHANFTDVTAYLKDLDYAHKDTVIKDNEIQYSFRKPTNTLSISIMNFVPFSLFLNLWPETVQSKFERKKSDFNMGIMIHSAENSIDKVECPKATASAVQDIGAYAKEEGCVLCIPSAIGWINPTDHTRIVYYP